MQDLERKGGTNVRRGQLGWPQVGFHDNTSGASEGVERQGSLDGNIHDWHIESLKHDLGHALAVGLWVKAWCQISSMSSQLMTMPSAVLVTALGQGLIPHAAGPDQPWCQASVDKRALPEGRHLLLPPATRAARGHEGERSPRGLAQCVTTIV